MVLSVVFHHPLVRLVFYHDSQAHQLVVQGFQLFVSLFLLVLEGFEQVERFRHGVLVMEDLRFL